MNRKNLTAAVLAGLTGAAGLAGAAQAGVMAPVDPAVNLNPDGLGEVLIYPYYTTNDDNTTLLTVVNTTSDAKAVKVRFLEGYNSREVLDFNLYMSEYDVWVAAISDSASFGAEAGVPHLFTPDTSCTVPYIYDIGYVESLGGGLQEFLSYAFDGSNNDGGPDGISRAAEGYVEIIEMGTMVWDGDEYVPVDKNDTIPYRMGSAEAATHVIKEDDDGNEYIEPADCQLLVDNWTLYTGAALKPHPMAGWWVEDARDNCPQPFDTDDVGIEPGCGQADNTSDDWPWAVSTVTNSGGLFGGAAIINVPKGTMFSYDAKAIQGYDTSWDGVHFYPGTIYPSLNSGSTTDAVVFLGGGVTKVLDYARGVDAISAIFMHDILSNTYVIDEDINAGTEWVMTLPTKAWYVDDTINETAFSYYTPDPADPGCNGWDPGEPNPYTLPVYRGADGCNVDANPPNASCEDWGTGDDIPDASNTIPSTGEDWSTCTPVKNTDTDTVAPFTTIFDGDACEPVAFKAWDREESPSIPGGAIIPPVVSPAPPAPERPGETPFELCYEVNVLRFGDVPVFGTESDLLYEVTGTPTEGWARLTFAGYDGLTTTSNPRGCVACGKKADGYPELHVDSEGLRGLPVTGFSAEQYTNGELAGGVLANYGGLFQHKGSVWCYDPRGSDCVSSE